jgi:hypothetical protein
MQTVNNAKSFEQETRSTCVHFGAWVRLDPEHAIAKKTELKFSQFNTASGPCGVQTDRGRYTAYSFYMTPALCVSQERWPFPSLEVLRCGITKPRAIFFGNGSQRGVTDMTASR